MLFFGPVRSQPLLVGFGAGAQETIANLLGRVLAFVSTLKCELGGFAPTSRQRRLQAFFRSSPEPAPLAGFWAGATRKLLRIFLDGFGILEHFKVRIWRPRADIEAAQVAGFFSVQSGASAFGWSLGCCAGNYREFFWDGFWRS